MVWLNVYATAETDVEKIEGMFLEKTDVGVAAEQARRLADAGLRSRDIAAYRRVLRVFGMSEQQVRMETEFTGDLIPMPHGGYKFAVGQSSIEGRGVLASAPIAAGEIIGHVEA